MLQDCRVDRLQGFNSLQTGRGIQRIMLNFKTGNILDEFQFPSSGKGHPKRTSAHAWELLRISFNSLQARRGIQSQGLLHRRFKMLTYRFQFPSSGKGRAKVWYNGQWNNYAHTMFQFPSSGKGRSKGETAMYLGILLQFQFPSSGKGRSKENEKSFLVVDHSRMFQFPSSGKGRSKARPSWRQMAN